MKSYVMNENASLQHVFILETNNKPSRLLRNTDIGEYVRYVDLCIVLEAFRFCILICRTLLQCRIGRKIFELLLPQWTEWNVNKKNAQERFYRIVLQSLFYNGFHVEIQKAFWKVFKDACYSWSKIFEKDTVDVAFSLADFSAFVSGSIHHFYDQFIRNISTEIELCGFCLQWKLTNLKKCIKNEVKKQ